MTPTPPPVPVHLATDAAQAVVDSGLWHPTDTSTRLPLWALPLPDGDNVDPVGE